MVPRVPGPIQNRLRDEYAGGEAGGIRLFCERLIARGFMFASRSSGRGRLDAPVPSGRLLPAKTGSGATGHQPQDSSSGGIPPEVIVAVSASACSAADRQGEAGPLHEAVLFARTSRYAINAVCHQCGAGGRREQPSQAAGPTAFGIVFETVERTDQPIPCPVSVPPAFPPRMNPTLLRFLYWTSPTEDFFRDDSADWY